jgi:flagellar protein FlaI
MANELRKQMDKNPYLKSYVEDLRRKTSRLPRYYEKISARELQEIRSEALDDSTVANIIYPIEEGFVHINAIDNTYVSIEKTLDDLEKAKLKLIKEMILEKAADEKTVENRAEYISLIERLFEASVSTSNNGNTKKLKKFGKILLSREQYEHLRYYIKRDIIGYGPIQPLIKDPYIEDIHLVGTDLVHISHKAFQYGLETNVQFDDEETLNHYLVSLSERMGRPVSAARPIVDGTLPDGSRINMIYSNDISQKGSSFTIRKFSAEPLSCIQLANFGTLSPELIAYIWICLEHKMSMMVSGETASGKTTTLNSIIPLIDQRAKIYSAEDTPEILPPHPTWQRCVTRESGPEESRVMMFDLLKASLRSRPDFIIIGEIRGEEGRVAFQAMQTGHPVLSTFHAASATKFIQRFTSSPINVPISFIDNLNILILQSAVKVKGRYMRRVTNVEELIGYSHEKGGVLTRNVFRWDPIQDKIVFRGLYNSFILEERIAIEHGFADKRDIYKELKKREMIIRRMMEMDISSYREVNETLEDYYEKGEESLKFMG